MVVKSTSEGVSPHLGTGPLWHWASPLDFFFWQLHTTSSVAVCWFCALDKVLPFWNGSLATAMVLSSNLGEAPNFMVYQGFSSCFQLELPFLCVNTYCMSRHPYDSRLCLPAYHLGHSLATSCHGNPQMGRRLEGSTGGELWHMYAFEYSNEMIEMYNHHRM